MTAVMRDGHESFGASAGWVRQGAGTVDTKGRHYAPAHPLSGDNALSIRIPTLAPLPERFDDVRVWREGRDDGSYHLQGVL